MNSNEIRRTLEKQLQLLSERSSSCDSHDLAEVTSAMCEVTEYLIRIVNQAF